MTPKLFLGKCKSHVGLKQPAEAISACTQALAQDGGMIDAYFQRAEAHLLVDDHDKALHDFHKAREIQPQNQQANEGIHRTQRLQKMAKRKDYYKILELTKTASDAEIRKAYRRLAKASFLLPLPPLPIESFSFFSPLFLLPPAHCNRKSDLILTIYGTQISMIVTKKKKQRKNMLK